MVAMEKEMQEMSGSKADPWATSFSKNNNGNNTNKKYYMQNEDNTDPP